MTKPWRLHQNYVVDLLSLRFGRLDDGVLRFVRRGESIGPERAPSEFGISDAA